MLNAKGKASLDRKLALLLKQLNKEDFDFATIKSTTERILTGYEYDPSKGSDAFCNRTLIRPRWREIWESRQIMERAWFAKSNANPLEADPLNRRGWEALEDVFQRMIALVVEGTTPHFQEKRSAQLESALCDYLALQGFDVSGSAQNLGPVRTAEAKGQHDSTRALAFSDAEWTITLHGKPYKIADPQAYLVYKTIWEAGAPITMARIQTRVQGCRGKKKIPALIRTLPAPLRRTVQSDHRGYWIDVSGAKSNRRKKGNT
jgi:hypothetical protein